MRTNYINAKINNAQQNSKCGDRDESINHRIIKCSKLAQKDYNTCHDGVGKVIQWELRKKLKYDHTIK